MLTVIHHCQQLLDNHRYSVTWLKNRQHQIGLFLAISKRIHHSVPVWSIQVTHTLSGVNTQFKHDNY